MKKNYKMEKDYLRKILTSNKLLTRLPVFLAQIKAGNNSYKLKIKIRQVLNLLYQHNIALQNFSIYYTSEKIGQQYKNNKLKIKTPTWNDEF